MAEFSQHSLAMLSTAHPDLQRLFTQVVKHWDCIVIEGWRGEEAQNAAVARGSSKLSWPHGKHNGVPSKAVDVAPLDSQGAIQWNIREMFVAFGCYVVGYADAIGIRIRWGGDWDGDRNLKNQVLFDLPHFELL